MAIERTGGCLCGAVRYRAALPSGHVHACHCGTCRRWAGGPALALAAPADAVTFDGAENLSHYASSEWAERVFCKTCGTHLYFRVTADGPAKGEYSLSAGTLDDLSGLSLSQEIYVDAKPACYAFAGDQPRLTEAEFLASIGLSPEGAPD